MTKKKSPSRKKKPGFKPRKPLTEMQQRTVMAFLNPECPSKSWAVRQGYPKAKNWGPGTMGRFVTNFWRNPNVIAEIERQREKIQGRMRIRYELTAERILDEMRCLALARATDVMQYDKVVDQWGRTSYVMDMTAFDQLTEESHAAIKRLKIRARNRQVAEKYSPEALRKIADEMEKRGELEVELEAKMKVQEIEVEMYDKQSALKDLGKYFNLFVDKLEVEHSGSVQHVHSRDEWRALFAEMTPEQRLEYAERRRKEILCEAEEVTDEKS